MPRPRRRCQGGRVTPKGTRPNERPSERRPAATPVEDPQLLETLLEDTADAAEECADLDEAEVAPQCCSDVPMDPGNLSEPCVVITSRLH